MKLTDKLWNTLILKRKRVVFGENLKINGRLFVHGSGKIFLGNNVTIHSKFSVNPTAGGQRSHLRAEGKGTITIGNNVGMSHVNIVAMDSVTIGDNVMLGSCVKIWDTDFHSINPEERLNGDINPKTAPVIIGDSAFIGATSIILKGVTIGKASVIGAGSVVTKNVPDGEVWGGNPAKFIKKLSLDD